MPIKDYQTFTYEGYTEGKLGFPTLYFKEGRYTQSHEDCNNIGWHPLHYTYCYKINITEKAKKYIMAIPLNDPKESDFAQKVVNGDYTATEKNEGILCECYTNDKKKYSVHISRGKLVKPSDSYFNIKYNEEYAKDILAKGVLAPNK
jgi:hypothetical protein